MNWWYAIMQTSWGIGRVVPDDRPFSLAEATGGCRCIVGQDEKTDLAELYPDDCPDTVRQAWWWRGREPIRGWRHSGQVNE